MRNRLALALLLVCLPFLGRAAEVLVTARVEPITPPEPPDTAVVFRGISYPATDVTIVRDESLLATVPADPQARFDVAVHNQPAGTFTYSVRANDAQGRQGRPMDFTVTLTPGITVTLTGIFLGPTIVADKDLVELGGTVTVLGTTAPQSEVAVLVSSEETKTFTTLSGSDGLWVRQILSTDVGVGDHNVRAKAVTASNDISEFSNSVAFSVREALKPPSACDGKNRADLNCDGKVNLTDFSILLFFWRQRTPANPRADINVDAVVNLTDASIMFFNWTK